MTICGESGEVSSKTADSWKERLPEIVQGYKPEDVWEIGCFWKALPGKGFAQKRKVCHGGKSSKVQLAVAFFVNASGESSTGEPLYNNTLGTQNFVHYNEVSLSQRFPVYFR